MEKMDISEDGQLFTISYAGWVIEDGLINYKN